MDISIVYKTFYEKQAFQAAYSLLSRFIEIRNRDHAPLDVLEDSAVKDLVRDIEKSCAWLVARDGGL